MVEFALTIPVFLLLVLGIFQAVLIFHATSSMGQAASDAAHVLAAQSSSMPQQVLAGQSDPRYPYNWQADGQALSYIRAALTGIDLSRIREIDVYSADVNGQPLTTSVTASPSLAAGSPAQQVTLENRYVLSPSQVPAGEPPYCQVDQFYLANSAAPASGGSIWSDPFAPNPDPITHQDDTRCVLPWNGQQFSAQSNQNGRNDQRCSEARVYVKIIYDYRSLFYPLLPPITLVGHDMTTLEPRQYMVDAGYQVSATC